MKKGKAARAMEHLDERLILSAMDASDREGGGAGIIIGGKQMKQMKKKNTWKKWASLAAAFAIVASAVLVGALALSGGGAIVALDVNPSIEITLNKREEIRAIRANNPEAEAVLAGLIWEGKDWETVMDEIIGALVTQGYLSAEQNSILVSVDTKNSKKASQLKEKLAGEIHTLLEGRQITASVITQNFQENGPESEKAEAAGISRAKAAWIAKILSAGLLDANGVPYTYETLAQLKVNDLKLILESKDFRVNGMETSGQASGGQYITPETARATALAAAGLAETEVTRIACEMDYDDDQRAMVYEVEFRHGENQYEYEIAAKTGDILEEEIEPIVEREEGPFTPPADLLSRTDALAIAYRAAGVEESAVRRPEIELDRENGTGIYVYEIEFRVGDTSYEYTVHAQTGEIREEEIERED